MTLKKAQRLIDCSITTNSNPDSPGRIFAYAEYGGVPFLGVCGKTLSEALEELVKSVYKQRGQEILKQQNGRCARCGNLTELQEHHKKYRSHGGTHAKSNIEMLCHVCHGRIHGERTTARRSKKDK